MQDYIQFAQQNKQNMLLVAAFFGLLTMLIVTELKRVTRSYTELSTHEAVRLMNADDTIVVDIREKKDLANGVLAGAKHIPLKDLTKRLTELEKHKNKNILVYDDAGIRSGAVCQQLTKAGFEQVSSLKGGVSSWTADNLPLEK